MSDDAREREEEERLLRKGTTKKEENVEIEEEEEITRHTTTPNAGISTKMHSESKEQIQAVIHAYLERFRGKPGFVQPVEKDGCVTFSFPMDGDAESFFMDEAQKGNEMLIIDAKTGVVLAYSTGADGVLYHSDGRPFEEGDRFEPSNIKKEDFTLPETAPKPRM